MPNGNPRPSGPEVEALVRRSALLAAKVSSLVQDGFSRDEAMQILFADIEAGLTEFGTPAPTAGLGVPAISVSGTPSLDMSTLIGDWNITPSPLEERCNFLTSGMTFSLDAVSAEIVFVGQGQSRIGLLFRDADGGGVRAEGSVASTGGSKFEFLGEFDMSRIRLRLDGSVANNTLEVTFYFEYEGTPFAVSLPALAFNPCLDSHHPRTLVRT